MAMAEDPTMALLDSLSTAYSNMRPEDLQDPIKRHELLQHSRKLTLSLERPEDTILLRGWGINLNMCIRIGIDLGIFKFLAAHKVPVYAKELACKVGAEELLVIRIMRGICVVGFADEVGFNQYVANKVTNVLARPPLEAGYALLYDNAARPRSNLSEIRTYFMNNGYKNPESALDGPYQTTNDCVGTNVFDHWVTIPGEIPRFNEFMHAVRGSRPPWSDWFPGEIIFDGFSPSNDDGVLVVDVAGGHGHDLQAFARRYPNAQGKMVLQDLPTVLKEVDVSTLDNRIQLKEHDFFQPQPVRGARVYFMHMIMHDWPDTDCIKILSNLEQAMTPGYSMILINDAIMDDQNATMIDVSLDITMMVHHSGLERSRQMWIDLIEKVKGLNIVKFWQAPAGEGIIQIEKVA